MLMTSDPPLSPATRAIKANGVTVTPLPIKNAINPDFGLEAPPPPPNVLPSRAINALVDRAFTRATIQSMLNGIKAAKSPQADGVTITPPPAKFTVDIDEGLEPPLPPPDALQSRAIDAQLLVDRALARSAKALLQSVLKNVKPAKSPPSNGVTAPPPVQPTVPPGNGVTATPPPAQAAAPPGNSVPQAAPPPHPAAPDALPVRAFDAELLADQRKVYFTVDPAPPPPVQPVAPPSKSVTDPVAPPPTIPDALPVRAIDAELLVDRALASSAKSAFQSIKWHPAAPPPPQPVTPPSNGVPAAPPPAQAAAPPSNSITDAAIPPPVIPDALRVRAVGAGAASRRTASSKRTWASRWSVNLS
ncbi:hypothetical protein EDB89DRAFT_2140003 [Lactarius sanguifluus]|nr:hypothetical protein EDB89DRAFT_2140003 [Lactarius sanguifluus]